MRRAAHPVHHSGAHWENLDSALGIDGADAAWRAVDARVDADLAEGAYAEQPIQFTTPGAHRKKSCTCVGNGALSKNLVAQAVRDVATQDALRVVLLHGVAALAMLDLGKIKTKNPTWQHEGVQVV